MIHKSSTGRFAAALAVISLAGAGCSQILGIEEATLYHPDAGSGGAGGSGGAPVMACTTLADCPAADACSTPVCLAGTCGITAATAGNACVGATGDPFVCDGAGHCVECLSNQQCVAHHPAAPICDLAAEKCVSCGDGVKNGQETGVDCGGPDCAGCLGGPCHAALGCASSALCAAPENLCCATPCGQKCEACSMARTGQPDGTCAPVISGQDPEAECTTLGGCGAVAGKCRCEDGLKNGDESDVDCGGSCAPCGGGKTCVGASDCAASVSNCVDGICCDSTCELPCNACNPFGQCVNVPAGSGDPFCSAAQVCGANGAGCVGKAGTTCSSPAKCLSGVCTGGTCAKSAFGKPCNTTSDCAAGTCTAFVCQ